MTNITPPASIGIIGVGRMGIVIAQRLVEAGYQVNGYRRGSLDDFAAVGGVAKTSNLAVAESSDLLIVLVPSPPALLEVMAEIVPGLRPGKVIICLATHPVRTKQAAADIAREAGAILLDGEISGTPPMVTAGQATVIIAGDDEAIERAQPVIDAFARATTRLNEFGDAVKMKVVTNYLVGVHTLAAAEAMQYARRLGLDPQTVVDTISGSAGGSTMMAVRGPMMAKREYASSYIPGFMEYFALLRQSLADKGEGGGPLLELTEKLYQHTVDTGFGNLDIAGVHEAMDAMFEAPDQVRRS